ncbi:hypothetical protein ACTFIU_003569 [Dictyostelium citrinum]
MDSSQICNTTTLDNNALKIVLNESVLDNLLKEHSKNSDYSIIKSDYQISQDSLDNNLLVTGQSGINLSHGTKTMGAIKLHNQSANRGWNLKNFVNASSTLTGPSSQCAYVCENRVLDSLSCKSIGLPSICSYYGSTKSGIELVESEHQINEITSKSELSTNNSTGGTESNNEGVDWLLLSKVSELLSIEDANSNADITLTMVLIL